MDDTLALWDWRRRIAELYAAIRAEPSPAAGWALWCRTRAQMFRTHPQSPIEPDHRAAYRGPEVFAYDDRLRFAVPLRPAEGAALDLPAGADGRVGLTPFARTDGLAPSLGGELTLFWIGGYGGGVLLPFADATSGRRSYGGGRYVLDTIKGADLGSMPDGRVILDFNFAYAPSCAHSARYICPLPPPGNRLPGAVEGGERL
jgi:uncharacterized protein (DUF1684 family)